MSLQRGLCLRQAGAASLLSGAAAPVNCAIESHDNRIETNYQAAQCRQHKRPLRSGTARDLSCLPSLPALVAGTMRAAQIAMMTLLCAVLPAAVAGGTGRRLVADQAADWHVPEEVAKELVGVWKMEVRASRECLEVGRGVACVTMEAAARVCTDGRWQPPPHRGVPPLRHRPHSSHAAALTPPLVKHSPNTPAHCLANACSQRTRSSSSPASHSLPLRRRATRRPPPT